MGSRHLHGIDARWALFGDPLAAKRLCPRSVEPLLLLLHSVENLLEHASLEAGKSHSNGGGKAAQIQLVGGGEGDGSANGDVMCEEERSDAQPEEGEGRWEEALATGDEERGRQDEGRNGGGSPGEGDAPATAGEEHHKDGEGDEEEKGRCDRN